MPKSPALLISFLLASAYATAWHLWRGGSLRALLLYWVGSLVGFAGGQLAGAQYEMIPFAIGQIHIVEATLGSLFVMFLLSWLIRSQRPT
jgi:hypothetical protein